MGPVHYHKVPAVTLDDVVYKIGDNLIVHSDSPEGRPFIGLLKEIQVPDGKAGSNPHPDKVKLKLAWYYRPDEVLGGRKVFHGRDELLRSDHADWVPGSTVVRGCRVLTLDAYRALDGVPEDTFYWQFRYLPATQEFRPERVAVFCTCQLPYSPDLLMVQCGGCEEWYHPHCVGMSRAEAEALEKAGLEGVAEGDGPGYLCPPCVKEGRALEEGKGQMAVRRGGGGGGGGVAAPAAEDGRGAG